MTDETPPPTPSTLGLYKAGQAKTSRWAAYLLGALLIFLGALSLYGFINRPGTGILVEGLPILGTLTWFKLIAVFVFILGVYVMHRILNRPAMVDLLIDTEQELRKVSWPSKAEVKNATLVVALVTFVMGFILFWADELLQLLFRFFF